MVSVYVRRTISRFHPLSAIKIVYIKVALIITFCALQNIFLDRSLKSIILRPSLDPAGVALEDIFIACSPKQLQNKLKETKNGP